MSVAYVDKRYDGRCRTYKKLGQKLVAIAYEDNWYAGGGAGHKRGQGRS